MAATRRAAVLQVRLVARPEIHLVAVLQLDVSIVKVGLVSRE
jgi:hypothetical protein